VVTSDDAFLLGEVPERIVIIGASAVGAEWASMFSAFGADVAMVELLPTPIPAEDEDLGKALARSFAKRGIKVQTRRTVSEIAPVPGGLQVTVTDQRGWVEVDDRLHLHRLQPGHARDRPVHRGDQPARGGDPGRGRGPGGAGRYRGRGRGGAPAPAGDPAGGPSGPGRRHRGRVPRAAQATLEHPLRIVA
jgi:hypothetical protein